MKKMSHYIGRHVLIAMVIVIIVLTALNGLFTLLSEISNLRMHYQLPQAIVYIAMSLPNMALQVLPVSALIGCIIGLGALANHSELVVMRASGLSLFRICWFVIKPALLLIVVGMLVGEYIVPHLQSYADTQRSTERSYNGTYSEGGLWWRDGNDYIYIGEVKNNILKNVDLLLFNDQHQIQKTVHAERVIKKGTGWELQNATSVIYSLSNMKKTFNKTQQWDIHLDNKLLKMAATAPENLSISSLISYVYYMDSQHLDSRLYQLSLYNKIFEPLAVISLLLIGASFIFGPLRSVTMGYRLFMGVATGVLFMLLQSLMAPASIVFNFPPFLAVLFPIILCLAIAIALLRKAG